MKKSLLLVLGLFTLTFATPVSAGDKSYPEKDPVLTYSVPDGWKPETDKDGAVSINSPDGRVSINFVIVPVEASLEIFEKMLPDMVKALGEGAAQVDKPKEHTEDGLTGFTATYSAKIEGKPATAFLVLFKGGKDRAVLANMIVSDPDTLPKEVGAGMDKFMSSLKGAK